ncbi:MAG: sugar ABC transporter ATP-binding protein [Spirochaetales bacterium]|nr:sugar ABC transporter ATP-binding protein [Spirochaetales bacterium]MCF7938321.1 sugar ABC transporter ATP-binding protein [Spirochaetales bacterium]
MDQTTNTKNILKIEGIYKAFPGVQALSDVHIELRESEVHAVCGENGAGKSTLMKIITGVHKPDEGTILLQGDPLKVKDPNDAYSKGIAIIYQESSLFPDLTVLENMFMGHEIEKPLLPFFKKASMIDYPAMRKKARAIFNRLGMDLDLDTKITNLGVATKQMVEIAKALSLDSRILILDEPTAALTSKEVDTLFETIKRISGEGVSMLYISHRLDEIFQIADRVTVLRDGQYINTEDVVNVTKPQLVSWMVGRDLDNLYPKEQAEISDVILDVRGMSQEGVIENIGFTLKRGEILGISGLAGAGRTEMAQALCGLRQADSGTIYLNGEEVRIHDYRDALDHGIAYISEDRQKYSLVEPMSVKVNITHKVQDRISNALGIIDEDKENEITETYMNQLDIKAPDGEFIAENLSGGNQQKLSVAKSLAVEPQILILDEPTRGVDVGAKSEIHRIISRLAKAGKSIILISSDLPEILGMSDRVIIIKQGSVVGELMRNELSQEKILEKAL